MTNPRVFSINVGAVRTVEWRGRYVTTGIWKRPVMGRVALRGVNFEGDDQADRTVHGGPDKAVYSYAREDYEHWREHERIETSPGLFGENLTTQGVDLSSVLVGERWSVGSVILEVAQPRLPCFKLGIRMGDPLFPRRFQQVGRMGAYFRIVEEGEIEGGDGISVVDKPAHGVSLRDMVQALDDERKADALRAVAYLPEFWRRVAEGR